jgi:hypothetical protein
LSHFRGDTMRTNLVAVSDELAGPC